MGLILIVGAVAIFIVAVGGVFFCSMRALSLAAGALAKRNAAPIRRRAALAAALYGAGVVASAAAGFLGITSLAYWAATA